MSTKSVWEQTAAGVSQVRLDEKHAAVMQRALSHARTAAQS